ncbi:FYVE, RhoGEF and PH domain-containing protein 6-like [Convolutriloba macropyga]|uniref:FYVE, RhoGEF and PH domain-containing protein 6-like n=1 Tax=Convolutriloba macropyga TaxID=536237 RepID=UPI003F521F3F
MACDLVRWATPSLKDNSLSYRYSQIAKRQPTEAHRKQNDHLMVPGLDFTDASIQQSKSSRVQTLEGEEESGSGGTGGTAGVSSGDQSALSVATTSVITTQPSSSSVTSERSHSNWYPELVSQMDEVMRAKHKRYLDNIYFGAEEIVQTEKNYNIKIRKLGTGLKAALEHNPQIAHFFEKSVNPELHTIMISFCQMEKISEVLTQEFKWNPDAGQIKIAQALKKVAKFLTVYNTYVTEHDKLSQAILHAIEKHANLREFFEMHIGGSLFYELKSIMMEPVQRILRYKLLLEVYKKHQDKYYSVTKVQYCDYEDTLKALEETKHVADMADMAFWVQMREREMDELLTKISGIDLKELVTPDRRLVKQEIMTKSNRNGYEERLFVLFSDVLMYFMVLSENSSYLFKQKMELTYVQVEIHRNKEDRELVIRSKDRSVTVICKDTEQQTTWYEAINKTSKEHKDRLRSIGQLAEGDAIGQTAPVWIRDDTVSACQIPGCKKKFSTFNRYHHCRSCGRAICSECSKVAFVPYKQRRDRVCILCYMELEPSPSESALKYLDKLKMVADNQKKSDKYAFPADDDSHDMCGVLEALREGTWKTSYYAVNQCVIYEYIQKNDIRAISTQPLISWRVKKLEHDVNHRPAEFCFRLEHENTSDIVFRANSKNDRDNWVSVLRRHVMGEPLHILNNTYIPETSR